MRALRAGTRGSQLALVQTRGIVATLKERLPDIEIEIEIIKTTGDKRTDVPLIDVAKAEGHLDKGVFIKELETALAAGAERGDRSAEDRRPGPGQEELRPAHAPRASGGGDHADRGGDGQGAPD